ncbi:hypothetical protein L228DRAFT_174439 [Xylona heveae TC161]|uniref:Uncharacterized protein n=1 Tax=Xylona heveae (strain CBS 132557 / TC161) TaxID=1328760 RepID=A0A165AJM8_XYLHT|nr:hypothetical protein L228DRAFT_174439 [Xylona heveae TC161]KZF20588.1 hypothetical protein L228DRAFT_174439 [Xylona heveae TC161]
MREIFRARGCEKGLTALPVCRSARLRLGKNEKRKKGACLLKTKEKRALDDTKGKNRLTRESGYIYQFYALYVTYEKAEKKMRYNGPVDK